MATPTPPRMYGQYYDDRGELRPIGGMIPGGGLLNAAGINIDAMMMNLLTGNQFAYQQMRVGQPNQRITDIWMHEQQKRYFDFGNYAHDTYKQRVLQGFFGGGNPDPTSMRKASNAMSVYNPVGLATELAMFSMGGAQADASYAQAFMAANVYAPGIGGSSGSFGRGRNRMTAFVNSMKGDLTDNPLLYGGANWAEQAQVLEQMSKRSLVGAEDMSVMWGKDSEGKGGYFLTERSQQTKQSVQEMTKAVKSMQELFGGSIPELFDKMDRVFGGTASAMGGKMLESRVLRLKQMSALTGQSMDSITQMMMAGGEYAERGGFDAGIGATAAEVTGMGFGVNTAGMGFGSRRINEGRLRAMSVRMGVAAGTSKMSQYYAGAYQYHIQRTGRADTEAERQAFFEDAQGITNVGGLARLAGGSVSAIQTASLSDDAKEMMADDRRVSRFGIGQNLSRVQRNTARSIRRSLERRLGRPISMSMIMRDGQLLGSDDIAANFSGGERAIAAGIVDSQMEGMAKAYMGAGATGQELQKMIAQQRQSKMLEDMAERRAALDAKFGPTAKGPMGVLAMLSDPTKTRNIGNYIQAAFGVTGAKDVLEKFGVKGMSEKLSKAYQSGDLVTRGKIQSILSSVHSERFLNLDESQQRDLAVALNQGDYDTAYEMLGTGKQKEAESLLDEYGGTKFLGFNLGEDAKAYRDAINSRDRGAKRQIGRKIAANAALGGIENDKLRDSIRSRLFDDKGQFKKFKSVRDIEKQLEGLDMDSEDRADFISDLRKGAEALDAGDPTLDMKNILQRLTEAIEALVNKR